MWKIIIVMTGIKYVHAYSGVKVNLDLSPRDIRGIARSNPFKELWKWLL